MASGPRQRCGRRKFVDKQTPAGARLAVLDRVATITLDRPERLNALDRTMHRALARCFDLAAQDDTVRVVVLTGAGRAFSTGQDLAERAAAFAAGETPDLRASLEEFYNPLVRRIAQLPIPVIAAVNGLAFGAGAALAVACDVTLAARSARFQFGFANVGLGPDSGASWLLPRLVGSQRAMDLVLSGRPVSGEEAERIGLAARCIDDDCLLAETRELAGKIAGAAASAIDAIKRQMRRSPDQSLDEALDAERDAQAALGRTPEYRAAVTRFASRARA